MSPKQQKKKVPTSILNKLLPLLSILYVDDQMLWGIQI
jgi:hypothetical protein